MRMITGEEEHVEEVLKIKSLMETDRPVGWDGLPDIDLYMDQVVAYLPRQTAGGNEPSMTSAMINNYVKDGLMPRACGKRYHREHLVYLTVIGLLKNVLTVKDMKLLLEQEIREGEEEQFYQRFLTQLDGAYQGVGGQLSDTLEENNLADAAMSLALLSCAAKTACEHLLAVMGEKNPEEEPKKEKPKKAKADKKAEKEAEKASGADKAAE